MYVDVALLPEEVQHMPFGRFAAVAVIDVLRATTTMVAALENGARGVVPVATPSEAYAWRAAGAAVLLGGERGARRVAGFDLGNSPREYRREMVADRLIILATTNGTKAFGRVRRAGEAGAGTPEIIAACLRNARAAARHLWHRAAAAGGDMLVVCAGTDGWFSGEDAYCAAVLVDALRECGALELGDGARAAVRLGAQADSPWQELSGSRHGRRLLDLGFHEDVAYCAETSVTETVPRLAAGVLVAAGGPWDASEAGAKRGNGE